MKGVRLIAAWLAGCLLAVGLLTGCSKGEPAETAASETTAAEVSSAVVTTATAAETTTTVPPTTTSRTTAAEPETPPAVEEFRFTRANMPRLNGSTSTVPLAAAVCSHLLGEDAETVNDLVCFSKTTEAYYALLEDDADLLIVGEANDAVLEYKEELNFEWLKTPFATDAFVFVVNESNPVDSITVEQARDIYTGKIKNWKQLGGEDRPIVAVQRNQGAGSQTLME